MSTLKKCDFCESIQIKGEKFIYISVNIGRSDYGSRWFDMCPSCQSDRGIELHKTTEVHAKSVFEELIRGIAREENER